MVRVGTVVKLKLIAIGLVAASSVARAETLKSEGVASALSVSPTVVGLGLAGAGLYIANLDPTCSGDSNVACVDHFPLGLKLTVAGGALLAVGPSLGHIYNGRPWTTGLKVRLVGTGIAGLGLATAVFAPSDCDAFVCPLQGVGMLVVIGGAATFAVGAGIDAVRAQSAVRERNAQLTVTQLRTPSGSAPGLMFHLTF
jgi:hypothetical protein